MRPTKYNLPEFTRKCEGGRRALHPIKR